LIPRLGVRRLRLGFEEMSIRAAMGGDIETVDFVQLYNEALGARRLLGSFFRCRYCRILMTSNCSIRGSHETSLYFVSLACVAFSL
jgi:hypothetical protein